MFQMHADRRVAQAIPSVALSSSVQVGEQPCCEEVPVYLAFSHAEDTFRSPRSNTLVPMYSAVHIFPYYCAESSQVSCNVAALLPCFHRLDAQAMSETVPGISLCAEVDELRRVVPLGKTWGGHEDLLSACGMNHGSSRRFTLSTNRASLRRSPKLCPDVVHRSLTASRLIFKYTALYIR